jgi:diguanylate cyclase (GGDEF)-like protein
MPLLLFELIPAVAALLQAFVYGVLLMWNCSALSLVIVYVFIQQRMIQYDSLTGAWTRASFDHFIEQKAAHSSKPDAFGMIFIDLDNFKQINDRCGHLEGDVALKEVVRLIRSALRKDDVIARFGGDEFCILISETTENGLRDITARIAQRFIRYNSTSEKPYRLLYSIGYEVYDPRRYTIGQFLEHVDNLMYANKMAKKHILADSTSTAG